VWFLWFIAQEVEKCEGGNRLHHMYPPTIERTDAEIFEDLLAGADQAYAEVDAVFESNGLAHIETTHSDARMRSDGAKGMCLEMFANKVLPFDMHSTGTAAWHHFVFAKQRTPSRFYNYNSPKVRGQLLFLFLLVVHNSFKVDSNLCVFVLLECGCHRRYHCGELHLGAPREQYESAYECQASASSIYRREPRRRDLAINV
jgi:hypothetical protein